MLNIVPITLATAQEFIDRFHRHHRPPHKCKFNVGCFDSVENKLVGVVVAGRPVSRVLDNGFTIEVIRLCTDGTPNACSMLYQAAARVAKEMGYKKIVTYILESESGVSLKASGWKLEGFTKSDTWDTPARHRETTAPTEKKQRWVRVLG